MPKAHDMPQGALILLILRVLQSGPLHGYAIAQRIYLLSQEVLQVEEGSLYPALQKMSYNGWVSAVWGVSDSNRRVRTYSLTAVGREQLSEKIRSYQTVTDAIQKVLKDA